MDELFRYPELLLTKSLKTQAAVRNYIGYVAELFVCRALCGERLSKGSEEIVPDMRVWDCTAEIKSVGKNNRALIYKWRLEKELRLLDPDKHLYVFCQHHVPITLGSVAEIVQRFTSEVSLTISTLSEVRDTLLPKKVRKFSLFTPPEDMPVKEARRIGYNRAGYIEGGWQFNVDEIPTVGVSEVGIDWAGTYTFAPVRFTERSLAHGG